MAKTDTPSADNRQLDLLIEGNYESQKKLIENHLREYRSITSREAMAKYGVMRLAAVVFQLRKAQQVKKEYWIDATTEEAVNRYGKTSRFSRYTLIYY